MKTMTLEKWLCEMELESRRKAETDDVSTFEKLSKFNFIVKYLLTFSSLKYYLKIKFVVSVDRYDILQSFNYFVFSALLIFKYFLVFSLFTVVRFKNDPCVSGSLGNGTCYTK